MAPRSVWLLAALVALVSGGNAAFAQTPRAGGPPPLPPGIEIITTTSGLQYADLVIGTGPSPEKGQSVAVHYTGWLDDGMQIDSTRDRGTALGFTIGSREVIRGMDEGVESMHVGGRRRLIIPPELGYARRGIPGVVPSNARLTFDVELLKILK
jgi:peptidylprolyl isomerase